MSFTSVEERLEDFKNRHKNAHVMKVEHFSVLTKHNVELCESSVFDMHGYKWKLVLYPGGKECLNDDISLYVEIDDTDSLPDDWEVNADLDFFVLGQRERKWKHDERPDVCFSSSNTMEGTDNLISKEMFESVKRGYYVNDSATFGVKIKNVQQCGRRVIPRDVGTAECLRMIEKPPNSKFTWKITKFSTFNQVKHFSHPFVVGKREWRIEIYPRGYEDEEGESLSVFLTPFNYLDNDAPKARTFAKFKLRVLDQLYHKHREVEFEDLFGIPDDGGGDASFMPLKDLHDQSKGFLMNDMMYIGVEFEVVSVSSYC